MLKRSSLFACVGLTALFLTSPTLALVSGEGSTFALSGEYATSGGEATYSLPIALPKGRAEHTPTLSLDYQSDSPNGLMGMGWTLGGTSSIYRCGKNLDVDGNWGGVNFDDNDRYCLDGQRLIAVKGEAGKDLTEYRVRKNGYDKIVSFGQSGDNGPEYFKVWRTDGTVHEYGVTLDARVELPGQANVYKWARNRVTDLSKHNHIDYIYHEDNPAGVHQLESIEYVGGQVTLSYEARPDKNYQYLHGGRLERSNRLSALIIKDKHHTEIGRYHLSYQLSLITSRSLMASIRYCSASGTCTTPITFEWHDHNLQECQGDICNGIGNTSDLVYQREKQEIDFEKVSFMDVERDGIKEPYGLVRSPPTKTCGDGWQDNYKQWGVLQSPTGEQVEGEAGAYWLQGSLDNPTITGQRYGYKRQSAGTSCGNSPYYYLNYYEPDKSYTPEHDGLLVEYSDLYQDDERYPIDLNGDAKETLIFSQKHGQYNRIQDIFDIDNDGQEDYYTETNGGWDLIFYLSSQDFQPLTFTHERGNSYQLFGDINNDGYIDMGVMARGDSGVYLRVFLFDGHRFVEDVAASQYFLDAADAAEEKTKFIDYNADGYPELYVDGTFYLNEAGTINYDKIIGETLPDIQQFEDINGDGFIDFVTQDVEESDFEPLYTHTSSPYPLDKLSVIEEHSIDYWVSYLPANDPEVHTQQRYFAFPFINTTPTRYLVSKVDTKPKGYADITTLYHYEGAKMHALGGGFLGFAKVTEVEQAEIVTTTVSHYRQLDLPTAKELARETVYRQPVGSAPLSYSELDKVSDKQYDYNVSTLGKRYHVHAHQSTQVLSNQGRALKQIHVTQHINAFGVVTSETVTTEDPSNPSDRFTTTVSNDYVSEGYTTTRHTLNTVTGGDVDNIDTEFSAYEQGLTAYCPTSADESVVYYRANDEFVLLHGEVVTPILTHAHDAYYRYDVTGTVTDPYNGVTYQQGALTTITEDEFNNQSLSECGTYTYIPSEEEAPPTLGTTTSTVTQLITENGNEYWQVSAIAHSQSTTSHAASGLSKTIDLDYAYTSAGASLT